MLPSASKARHRLGSASVSWCLETSLFFRLPSRDGPRSLPLLSIIFHIFSYLLSKTLGCFSGCLMSSASIQKLFFGIYSVFQCSFDEFVGEKVISLSYSSTILWPPRVLEFNSWSSKVSEFLTRPEPWLNLDFFSLTYSEAFLPCSEF